MNLIIVESPTKAKTLSRFLGKDFEILSTLGHIKDLPKSKLAVDLEHDFEPFYEEVEKRRKEIEKIKSASKKAEKIFLASDPDREGEAIAQHVVEILKKSKIPKTKEIKRIEFHEITKEAIKEALKNPRDIDKDKVNAQIARRVLDRVVGYKLSPLLWKKVRRGLSAGRVQTVAVRLIVEREKEISAFKPQEYWEIFVWVKGKRLDNKKDKFLVQLVKINQKRVDLKNKIEVEKIVSDLKRAKYEVSDIRKKDVIKHAFPPFTTSTLSQAASRIFGWSARRTMRVAQLLYEKGAITYHRTDSVNIAKSAIEKVRSYINNQYGEKYLPETPNYYKTKAKSAQEAHEAIRPTNIMTIKFQESGKGKVSSKMEKSRFGQDPNKLYSLIWNRFVASQMAPAIYEETRVEVEALFKEIVYSLSVTVSVSKFNGWQILFQNNTEESPVKLPNLFIKEPLDLVDVSPEKKFTLPPARYTEASLIKALENLGIGRPSTYAPIIWTIQLRQYVEKDEGKFLATRVGIAVNDFLIPNFPDTFDYQFTAQMEENLDQIAEGKKEWRQEMKNFYQPFSKVLEKVEKKAKRVKIETEKVGRKCPGCKKGELVIRIGRFGKFISCSLFPECKYTERFLEKLNIKCPECILEGRKPVGEVILKKTKKGRKFYGCSRYPDCKWASWSKPNSDLIK